MKNNTEKGSDNFLKWALSLFAITGFAALFLMAVSPSQEKTSHTEEVLDSKTLSSFKLVIRENDKSYKGTFLLKPLDFSGVAYMSHGPVFKIHHGDSHYFNGYGEAQTGRHYRIYPVAWVNQCDVTLIIEVVDTELVEIKEIAENVSAPVLKEERSSQRTRYQGGSQSVHFSNKDLTFELFNEGCKAHADKSNKGDS